MARPKINVKALMILVCAIAILLFGSQCYDRRSRCLQAASGHAYFAERHDEHAKIARALAANQADPNQSLVAYF